MICALRTKEGGNTEIVKQEREISEAEWINVDEFLKVGSPHNTIYLQAYLDDLKAGRILTPTPFKMKYQKIDRHMLMYINKPINKYVTCFITTLITTNFGTVINFAGNKIQNFDNVRLYCGLKWHMPIGSGKS